MRSLIPLPDAVGITSGQQVGGLAVTLGQEAEGNQRQGKWDSLIGEMHAMREGAGTPSYDTLTRNLIEQRIGEGKDEHSARIGKSSVHDAFRFGRTRINETLVRELVRVMGGDSSLVETWVAACDTPPATSAWSTPVTPNAPTPVATVPVEVESGSRQFTLLLLFGCVALNIAGREFVDFFNLPFFLDMIGTAVAAIALGPWRGAGVGIATNVIGVIGSGWISLPFVLVNITGAFIWGYGVRRWGMGRTLPRFFALNVLTALACSLVAVPIIMAFLGQDVRVGHDVITQTMEESVDAFLVAVSFSNVLTSLGDKLLSGFVALVTVSSLPMAFRLRSQLVFAASDDSHARS